MKAPAIPSLYLKLSLAAVAIAALASPAGGDPAPQPQATLQPAAQGTFNVDWDGVTGRTYFMQFSTDLADWHYAPFIDFGDGTHRRGIHSDADKFFLRFHYGDFPGINSLDDAMHADFDGDGLSNIFEVTLGYDPFVIESTLDGPDAGLDPDGDGLDHASEQALGTDPMVQDNPLLQLKVIID